MIRNLAWNFSRDTGLETIPYFLEDTELAIYPHDILATLNPHSASYFVVRLIDQANPVGLQIFVVFNRVWDYDRQWRMFLRPLIPPMIPNDCIFQGSEVPSTRKGFGNDRKGLQLHHLLLD